MKTIIMALMCTLVVSLSYAGPKPEVNILKVSGYFKTEKNVSYEVCTVNEDSSCSVVYAGKGSFTFQLNLDVGKEYVISFTKDTLVKYLYVTVDEPGRTVVDVDFSNDNCAQMTYSYARKCYKVRVLLKPKYELREDNKYTAYKV